MGLPQESCLHRAPAAHRLQVCLPFKACLPLLLLMAHRQALKEYFNPHCATLAGKLALHCTAPLAVPVPREHLYSMSTAWQQCRLSTEQAAFCSTNASNSTDIQASHHHDPPLSMPISHMPAAVHMAATSDACHMSAGCHYGPLFPISLLNASSAKVVCQSPCCTDLKKHRIDGLID